MGTRRAGTARSRGRPRSARTAVLLAVAVGVTGCSGREEPEETRPPEEDAPEEVDADRTTFRGELYQTRSPVGTITMLSLEDSDGAFRLTGSLEEELRRLSGAEVEVDGERVRAYPDEGLDVDSYEILRIDGEKPHVGVVEVDEDGAVCLRQDEECFRLAGAPEGMREREDARIWVVGEKREREIRLASYGVIRP